MIVHKKLEVQFTEIELVGKLGYTDYRIDYVQRVGDCWEVGLYPPKEEGE